MQIHFFQTSYTCATEHRAAKKKMQSLQAKAAEWSGVDSADAFAIDESNLFEKLGLQAFVNLSTNFYNRFHSFVFINHYASILFNWLKLNWIGFWLVMNLQLSAWSPGFTTTNKNGSDQFLPVPRRKTQSKTSTSFSCREWEAPISTLTEEVCMWPFFGFFIFSSSSSEKGRGFCSC